MFLCLEAVRCTAYGLPFGLWATSDGLASEPVWKACGHTLMWVLLTAYLVKTLTLLGRRIRVMSARFQTKLSPIIPLIWLPLTATALKRACFPTYRASALAHVPAPGSHIRAPYAQMARLWVVLRLKLIYLRRSPTTKLDTSVKAGNGRRSTTNMLGRTHRGCYLRVISEIISNA
jgi:hypothetical protein